MDPSGAAPEAAEWFLDSAVMRRLREDVNSEFDEDDPRRGPFSLEEIAEAAIFAGGKGRWHVRQRNVDWLAVQLQYGRGRTAQSIAAMFGIGDSTISTRKREEKWISPMSERDRRNLARLVWIAGDARMAEGDAASRAALAKTSEWRMPQDRPPVRYQAKDKGGAPMTLTIKDEIPDDVYYSDADPRRDERIDMRNRLDDLIARMERDIAQGKTAPDGDVVPELAEDEGRAAESGRDTAVVGDVGERCPDTA